jgi:pimeloyl-ACP methyl ester carboxylesterase/DNA-binding CsgD family transcriptional regulator
MRLPPIKYAKTSDGYSIAYAVTGEGLPLVLTPHAFSHIQLYWQEQTFLTPWLEGLSSRFRLVQFDWRGQGMSTRGLRDDFMPSDLLADIEAVIESLALDRFILVGIGGPAHATVRYAEKNPSKVAALILFSFSAEPGAWSLGMFRNLPAENWDVFLESQVPHGLSPEETQRALSRLRQTVDQRDWLIRVSKDQSADLHAFLAGVQSPTLVVHPREYRISSEDACRRLAARIPGAIFASTAGRSVLGNTDEGLGVIDDFLKSIDGLSYLGGAAAEQQGTGLSQRQMEVLQLLAAGRTNREIAEALVLSERTVQRHISDIYTRLSVRNRAEATAYALTLRR